MTGEAHSGDEPRRGLLHPMSTVDVPDRSQVLALARRRAEPAVTILLPVGQPTAAHPENEGRLRGLVERALEITESWWGPEPAQGVATQLERPELQLEERGETAHGLALLVTPDDGEALRLPFPVDEQVVVNRTFATRQLLEGLARHPRHRVLVLDGHRAELYEGRGRRLTEVRAHGFPVHVEPPHEQDTPQRDLPIHEEAEREEHRIVYRDVDDALEAAERADPLPVVVTAVERELAVFRDVTRHADLLAGEVTGNYAEVRPAELAEVTRPVVAAYRTVQQDEVLERVREAHGHDRAVTGLHAVKQAVEEGRGHLLVVEEGFTFPGHWVDDVVPGEAAATQPGGEEIVDDVIEAMLLAGGEVEFVPAGSLSDLEHLAALTRY